MVTAWMLCGCATVLHGTSQSIEIVSTPPGATALILPGNQVVTTPATVSLERLLAHTVRLTLAGYETETVFLDRVTSGAIYGNLALGGMIGISVDASNGAAFQLVPRKIAVTMRPAPPPDSAPGMAELPD
jgi:hypothetical protein